MMTLFFLNKDDWYRVAPFALFVCFLVLDDFIGKYFPIVDVRWLYAVKTIVIGALLFVWRKKFSEIKQVRMALSNWLLAIVAGFVVFELWIHLNYSWMQMDGAGKGFDPSSGSEINWILVGFRVAGAVLVVPLVEELFWRSYLMRWLVSPDFMRVDPRQVKVSALIVSSVLFSLGHGYWFPALVAGLVFGLLYMQSKNLNSSIVAHGVANSALAGWVVSGSHWNYW